MKSIALLFTTFFGCMFFGCLGEEYIDRFNKVSISDERGKALILLAFIFSVSYSVYKTIKATDHE